MNLILEASVALGLFCTALSPPHEVQAISIEKIEDEYFKVSVNYKTHGVHTSVNNPKEFEFESITLPIPPDIEVGYWVLIKKGEIWMVEHRFENLVVQSPIQCIENFSNKKTDLFRPVSSNLKN